jgi:hypothetical protein
MKGYWSDKRADGQPIEQGTVCFVTDLEDGTHPIFTYGKDQAEVLDKLARQNANAQIALARRAAGAQPASPGARAVPPRTISADQIMQATQDLQNPAKAPGAIATLLEAGTGVDPVESARRNYAALAVEWEAQTPDFYPHPGNRQLVGDRAIRAAGGKPGMVTKQMLQETFLQLQAEGLLFERPDNLPANGNSPTLTTFPGESPVQPLERPRGTRFSTGWSGTRSTAPQTTQTRALKYTEEQIRTMPEKERRRVFDDPEYIAACDFYYSEGAKARA